MKASRLTAVGLVAAAGLWIASGHFLPHESAESRAAVRSGEGEAKKLFRVAVVGTDGGAAQPQAHRRRPHRGRQARHPYRAHRRHSDRAQGQARNAGFKKGDIIAVLSDEAREAQVAQAEALVTQNAPSSTPSAR